MLQISRRGHAGGLGELTKKSSLHKACPRRHRGNRAACCDVLLHPVLNFQYPPVPMAQLWWKVRVEALFTTRSVDQKEPSCRKHHGRRQETLDEIQTEINPGHHPASSDDVPVITGGAQRELIVTAESMNRASGNEIEVIDGVAGRERLELSSPGLASLK
jgi:hypothetical protein